LQVKNAIQRILGLRRKRIGVLGFAFKAGTDDLRGSPLVELIEALLGKGLQIKIYDRDVALARLTGTNKEYIQTHIPHIADLMVENIQEILIHSEIIIIGNKNEEFRKIFPHLKGNQHVLDLVRISESVETSAKYEGISW
jgi:GDP-mannose 6-dehydrogenase